MPGRLPSLLLLVSLCLASLAHAQQPDWQTKAGTKLSFDVASIRLDTNGQFNPLDITPEDAYTPTGNRFTASGLSLIDYVAFAYKIWLTPAQQHALAANLPKWVATDKFTIEARAPIDQPTKDQMRLMMQSLLADRFHLSLHFESHDLPVLALKLDRPGKLGPQLRPHSQGLPCDKRDPVDQQHLTLEMLPCNMPMGVDTPDRQKFVGFRDVSLNHFANFLPLIGLGDRLVVNQTGLTGTFDIAITIALWGQHASDRTAAPPEMPGATLLQALKDQLGLKLESTHAIIAAPIIDHVELPSEN